MNGAALLQEEAAKIGAPQGEVRARSRVPADGAAASHSGQTEEEARLLGEYNLYNG